MANNIEAVKQLQKEIDKFTSQLVAVNNEIIKISKSTREVSDGFRNIKTPNKVNGALKETAGNIETINALYKQQDSLEKNLINTQAKQKLAIEGTNKAYIKSRYELQQQNKLVKEAAVISSKLSTLMQKTIALRNKEARAIQDLNLKKELGIKLSNKEQAELKQSAAAFNRYDSAIKKAKASVGRFQENVGNYPKGLKAATNAARGLASALGLVGGAFLAVGVARDAIKTIRDFGKQNATLAGVLGVTTKETTELADEAKRLGSITVKTASEVTGLQLSYARLGFSQQEIINLTEATIQGSIALNSELGATAELTGAVVNTFDDFSSIDAPKILDIMSLATSKSALNFEKLQTGIPIVAGAANAAGIPFTKLVALLGKLSDSGIDVSSSSTSIRNIFIEAAARGDNYNKILATIAGSTDKLTASNDAFGKRAAVSASVLSSNLEGIEELDEALQGAAGTAQRMAENELNTLDGSIKLLSSAYEGLILDTNDATDVSNILKKAIAFLANNLKAIVKSVLLAAAAWGGYKIAIMLATLQTKLSNIQLVNSRAASLGAAKGIGKASIAFRNFNKVLKANAIGIAITALIALVALFDKYNKTLSENANELNKSNKELENYAKETTEVNNNLETLVERYDELKNKSNKSKKEQKELVTVMGQIAKIVPLAATEVDKYGNVTDISTAKVKEFIKANKGLILDETNKKLEEQQKVAKGLSIGIGNVEKALTSVKGEYVAGFGVIGTVNGQLVKYSENVRTGAVDLTRYTALTRDQRIEFTKSANELRASKKDLDANILTNKEIILNAQGLLSERQKLAKQSEENKKNEEEEVKILNESILLIPKLRAEIKGLMKDRQELKEGGISVAEEDTFNDIQKEIKARQARIKAILGENKARGERVVSISERIKFDPRENDNDLKGKFEAFGVDIDPKGIEVVGLDKDKIEQDVEEILANLELVDKWSKEAKVAELFNDSLNDLAGTIESVTGVGAGKFLDFFEKIEEGGLSSFENIGDLAVSSFSLASDVSGAFFQSKIDGYEADIEANNEYYANLLDNENLSDEEKERLETDRRNKEKLIEKEQKKEKEKQFKLNKAFSLGEIAVNTAVAVSKAAGQTGIFGIAASIPIIALGAAQAAIVASQETPKFKDGHLQGTHEGLAIINDANGSNYREVIERKDGTLQMYEGRDQMIHMDRGDKVHKAGSKKYLDNLSDGELIKNIEMHSILSSINRQNIYANRLDNKKTADLHEISTDRIVKAIKSQKTKFNLTQNINLADDLRYLDTKNNML